MIFLVLLTLNPMDLTGGTLRLEAVKEVNGQQVALWRATYTGKLETKAYLSLAPINVVYGHNWGWRKTGDVVPLESYPQDAQDEFWWEWNR